MNGLFIDTMTVYNYYKDSETDLETWHKNIVKGVQWSHNKNEFSVSGGVQMQTKAESITVDFQKGYDNPTYIDPISYAKLSVEELCNYWTLDAKNGQDVVVLGESDVDIDAIKYTKSDLANDFQYVATVKSVSDNRNRRFLQTIKVVAE